MFATVQRTILAVLALLLVQAGAARASEELYHKVALSTVMVYKNGGPIVGSAGTGFVIDVKERLVITARHVVENVTGGIASNIEVMFAEVRDGDIITESKHYQTNRQRLAVRCKVVYESTRRDMAILQLEKLPPGIKALELALTTNLLSETAVAFARQNRLSDARELAGLIDLDYARNDALGQIIEEDSRVLCSGY